VQSYRARVPVSVAAPPRAGRRPPVPRSRLLRAWRSSVGKKAAVAASGAVLVAYLVLHMVGNLSVFSGGGSGGEARIDAYSHFLRTAGNPLLPSGTLLWLVRGLLLGALAVHVTGIVQLSRRNAAARPAGHPARRIGRSWSARTMRITGSLLLVFVVFHVLQFTTLSILPSELEHGAIYANLYTAFHHWVFVVIYVVAVALVGLHLRHGVWSAAQTLGWDSPSRNAKLRHGATGLAVVVVVGFAAIPICFWTDILPAPAA
jgi:succinate dehydrogenase / fumarate reductase, cytochrome b subunit